MNLTELNPEQRRAVEATEGPVLIIAGAGSGKTRVITHRIEHLLKKKSVRPDRILALTFTNKAALEMKERTYSLLDSGQQSVWIATFHSACVRILRKHSDKIGFSSNFTIYDASESLSLLKESMKELDISSENFPPKSVAYRISSFKNELVGPLEQDGEGLYRDKVTAKIFKSYQDKLKENDAMDFDDLIGLTVRLFEQEETVCRYYRDRLLHIMVDEYQDTNHAQYRFLQILAQGHRNLCVVGDDDQSIYQWRGATIHNILGFEKEYPDATVIRLEENYRSTQMILSAAWEVVSKIEKRREKKLWTQNKGGERITLHTAFDERDEADFISRTISKLHSGQGSPFKDFSVFYRTNAQSRVLEDSFIKNNIPYVIFGGLKFYDRKEVKDIISYLKLSVNPNDSVSFKRVVNTPRRGVGNVTLEKIITESKTLKKNLVETANILSDKKRPGLLQFTRIMLELRENAISKKPSEVIEKAIVISGYRDMLTQENTSESRSRIENLEELISAAKEYEDDGGRTLTGFLETTSLVSGTDSIGDNTGTVSMMTLHLSKGLEFTSVFMAGMEEMIFPHGRSMDSVAEMDEERRLCYVGMTRAKERLYMTNASARRIFGREQYNQPSRFLLDIPEDMVSRINTQSVSPVTLQEDALFFHERETENGSARTNRRLLPGSKINHPLFGQGLILKNEGEGDGTKLTIYFKGGAGKKKIASNFFNTLNSGSVDI